MSTLYIDEEKIKNSIIPNIELAISNLTSAINIGRLKVPTDFDFYNYLSQLQNKNYNLRQSLINKKSQYSEFVKKYKLIERQNSDIFSEIQILDVVARNSFLKK